MSTYFALCIGSFLVFGGFVWASMFLFAKPSTITLKAAVIAAAGSANFIIATLGLSKQTPTGVGLISLAGFAISAGLFAACVGTIRRGDLPLIYQKADSARILDRGPYRLIRHPFYTAYSIY